MRRITVFVPAKESEYFNFWILCWSLIFTALSHYYKSLFFFIKYCTTSNYYNDQIKHYYPYRLTFLNNTIWCKSSLNSKEIWALNMYSYTCDEKTLMDGCK